MADMCFFAASIRNESGDLVIDGVALCSPDSESIAWSATVGWNDEQAAVNAACQAAAVAAAAAHDPSYTVGVLDNKICLAGAVGL